MLDSLNVSEDWTRLQISWSDGSESQLGAQVLRQQARDAGSVRDRLDHGQVSASPDIKITALTQVGAAGVNIHFSDGHERAIYPFVYLRELSERFDN